jgi:hypothetical protein
MIGCCGSDLRGQGPNGVHGRRFLILSRQGKQARHYRTNRLR